jgi:hypothetical protein
MGGWNPRREYALFVLGVIREADYDFSRVDRVVGDLIAKYEDRIREIEVMSDEEFYAVVSKDIFGVFSKGFYIAKFKRCIEQLKQVRESVEYLVMLYRENPKLFNWVLKQSYQGCVREMRKAIEKLASV